MQQKKCFVDKFKQEQFDCFKKSKERGVIVYEISLNKFEDRLRNLELDHAKHSKNCK